MTDIISFTSEDLRNWREQAKLDQATLAELLGLSRATIGRWESSDEPLPKWIGLAYIGWAASQVMDARLVACTATLEMIHALSKAAIVRSTLIDQP